jgi:hypothetical protein
MEMGVGAQHKKNNQKQVTRSRQEVKRLGRKINAQGSDSPQCEKNGREIEKK